MSNNLLTPPVLKAVVEPFYYVQKTQKHKRPHIVEQEPSSADYTTFHILIGIICFALNYKQNLENTKLNDFDRILRALVAALLGPLYLVVFVSLWTMQ
jgi:hypothetical protein